LFFYGLVFYGIVPPSQVKKIVSIQVVTQHPRLGKAFTNATSVVQAGAMGANALPLQTLGILTKNLTIRSLEIWEKAIDLVNLKISMETYPIASNSVNISPENYHEKKMVDRPFRRLFISVGNRCPHFDC
jgi:hypothetical protein